MDKALRTKAKVILIPEMRRAINPLLDIVAFIRLYRLMWRERYDIVHTHSSKAGILGRFAAKLSGRSIVIHTIHGLPFHPYQNRLLNAFYVAIERVTALITDKIITVCDAMKRQALSFSIGNEEKFITIHSGMKLKPFLAEKKNILEKRRELGLEENALVIGKVARLFPLKGHKYLIACAPDVIKAFPNVRFLLVGDGILRAELQRQIDELGLGDKFIFTGLVERERIPELISVMDLLVHTSLREGLARVLPQAMASGKPAISFDTDGANEVVINGETGYLVKPKDTAALSNTIIRLLSDAERLRELGRKGRELVAPVFSEETMVERIDKLYRDLIA